MELLEEIKKRIIKSSSSKKTTTINVQNIPCYTSIGINSEEKKLGQRLLIDVSVDVDANGAISSDNVNNTLSYVDIYKIIQEIGKSKSHSLIETLAENIADEFLKNPIVYKVKIQVHKPHIPYPEFCGDVSVEITRKK